MIKRGMKPGELFQDGENWYRVMEVVDNESYISSMVSEKTALFELENKPKSARKTAKADTTD